MKVKMLEELVSRIDGKAVSSAVLPEAGRVLDPGGLGRQPRSSALPDTTILFSSGQWYLGWLALS